MTELIPNVFAARYASAPLAQLWSPSTRSCSSVGSGSPCSGRRTTSASTCPTAIEAYEASSTTSTSTRSSARAGHPPRREGPHRRVRRAGRLRAHPQGHDVARPHRERRAAPGAGVARARAHSGGGGARPAGGAGHRARRAGDGRALAQRAGPGHDARQAVRVGGRGAARGPRALDDLLARYPAARHQGPDGHGAGPARSARRRRSQVGAARAGRRSPPGVRRTLGSVGQVYPRSLDLDVVAALVQCAAGPSSLALIDPIDGRQRARHRRLRTRPGRVRRRCRTR